MRGGILARALAALALLLVFAGTVHAQSISLAWNANTETDLSGYTVYYGTSSGVYPNNISLGKVTTYTVTALTAGQTYYFALKAVNTSGQSSGYSAQVSATVPATPTAPTAASSPSPANNAT